MVGVGMILRGRNMYSGWDSVMCKEKYVMSSLMNFSFGVEMILLKRIFINVIYDEGVFVLRFQ